MHFVEICNAYVSVNAEIRIKIKITYFRKREPSKIIVEVVLRLDIFSHFTLGTNIYSCAFKLIILHIQNFKPLLWRLFQKVCNWKFGFNC